MSYAWITSSGDRENGWQWPVGVTTVPVPQAAVQVYAQAIADHAAALELHRCGAEPCEVCASTIANLRAIASDMDTWTR